MEVLDELERRFAEAIERERAGVVPGGASRPPRRRRAWRRPPAIPTTVALATLAAAVVLALVALRGDDAGRWTAAKAWEQIAGAAERAPAPPVLHDDEQWYVRAEFDETMALPLMRRPGRPTFLQVRRIGTIERWTGRGDLGRMRMVTQRASFPDPQDRARWRAHARSAPPLDASSDNLYTRSNGVPLLSGMFKWDWLAELPTDPDDLLERIAQTAEAAATPARHGPRFTPVVMATTEFTTIADLLVLPLRPEVRAAMLRALPRIQGARLLGPGRDVSGREGFVVALRSPHAKIELVVGEDGRLLGKRGAGSPASAYVEGAVAPDVNSLPAGLAPPPGRLPRTRRFDPTTPAIAGGGRDQRPRRATRLAP